MEVHVVLVPVAQLNLDRRIWETYKLSELTKGTNLESEAKLWIRKFKHFKIMHVQGRDFKGSRNVLGDFIVFV